MNVPYRTYIDQEYVGRREKPYERELSHRGVVAIWGESGVGKTWVGAKLAIRWETAGFAFSPYAGSPRRAFWFECKEGMDFYELVFGVADYLRWQGQKLASTQVAGFTPRQRANLLSRLNQILRSHFNESELRDLCLDLDVDYGVLGGTSTADKARELITYLERRGRVAELVQNCYQLRPNVPWQGIVPQSFLKMPQESLWHWLHSRPDRVPPLGQVVNRLVELLNQEQYLLCFDDFHLVGNDPNVRYLFQELEKTLRKVKTKVLLMGRHRPGIAMIGGAKLGPMTRTGVQDLLLELEKYNKKWLDESIAGRFADKLIETVGMNLKLMNIVAIDWFRSHTTRAEAQAYLDTLDKARVANLVLEYGDQVQTALLNILSLLDDWEGRATLVDLARRTGIDPETAAQELDILLDAKLIQKDADRYVLHDSVRALCFTRQARHQASLLDLHRHIADVYAGRGDFLSAIEHYSKAGAFSKIVQVLADNTVEITHSGQAQAALDALLELQEMAEDHLDEWSSLWLYVLMSDLYAWLGRLGLARFAGQDGLELLERLDGKDVETHYLEGRLRARMGTILWEKGQHSEVMEYLVASEALMREYVSAGGARLRASRAYDWLKVLNNLGQVYRLRAVGQADNARDKSFNQAIRCYKETIDRSSLYGRNERTSLLTAFALTGLGQVYLDRNKEGDSKRAARATREGLEEFLAINHQWGVGFANSTLGELYFRQGDFDKAAQFRQQGLEAAYKCDDKQTIILTNAALAEIYIFRRDFETADLYLEAAKKVLAEAPIPYLLEFVSFVERWAKGIKLLQAAKLTEGCRLLNDVLKDFRAGGSDYAAEASLVEQQLKDFGCSVSEPETKAPTLPPPPPEPQDRIGRYQLRAELGKGAMGTVYQAYDPHTDRPVALKLMKPTSGPRAEAWQQRFRREARAAGKLQHPNIVLVHDADVADGQWYIVMEYLEGRTLEEIIADGSQALGWVKEVVAQVCDALHYAHERGVIHRDVKPSNIMILDDDQVKVTDFGLASVATDASLTRADDFLGTPCYMSPEQIQDPAQVDRRSDVFSLGAVVYELLTGKRLFPGEHYTPLHHITSSEPADLQALSEDLPDAVRQVLEKALAKDASQRFTTCAELSQALAHAAQAAYDTATMRELLCVAFDYEELIIFCHDHFPEVRKKFSTTMSLEQMAQRLIEYCERHLLIDHLLALVKQANPAQYEHYEPRLLLIS